MKETKKVTLIMVPYPALGHFTPMFRLALSFLQLQHNNSCSNHSFSFTPVLLLPRFLHRQILSSGCSVDPRISLLPIPQPEAAESPSPGDFFAVDRAMEKSCLAAGRMEAVVRDIVGRSSGDGVCMVVDLLVSSAIDVGRRCGVPVDGFWAVDLLAYRLIAGIPQMVAAGLVHPLSGSHHHPGVPIAGVLPPDQPSLSTDDLPWLIGSPSARTARFKFWTKTLQRSTTLQYLLVNSFPDQTTNHLHRHQNPPPPQILQVGPLTPTHPNPRAADGGVTFWKQDSSCLQFLNTQTPNSVLYIAFGSWVSPIGETKLLALATSLAAIRVPFIWVLGPAWRQGLPAGYEEKVLANGSKIVSWAPQVEVLKHRAVGCFLTHCGWNSTVEAVRCRKRMLCYPIAGDQFANCARVVEEWRVGVRLKGFGRGEVEEGLKKVMEDGEIGGKLERLCEMGLGGEARGNLGRFVDLFMH